MTNFSSALVKVVVLTGGAMLGAMLARWCDEYLSSHAQEQSEFDKMRYEQGLAPLAPKPVVEENQG